MHSLPESQEVDRLPATPLVSIITPAYNATGFIGETIESVLAQTYPHWELLVVDDGSTDGTAAFVRSFADSRIRVIDGGGTGLPAAGRNRGLAEATGELIAFLDHDDLWRPTKLERQVELMQARPEIGLVHTGADILRDGTLESADLDPDALREDALIERLLARNFICTSSVMIRRSVSEAYGPHDEDRALRATPDYEYWLRLATTEHFAFVPEPLVVYRVHGSNVTGNRPQVDVGIATSIDKTLRRHPELAQFVDPSHDRVLGITRCLAGLPGSGRPELWRAVRRRPSDLTAWKWLALALLGRRAVRRLRETR